MSLIDSLNAATSGMNAQSDALANISNNVANSQTIGFKGNSTTFEDYLGATATGEIEPGAIVAQSQASNTLQGTVTQVSDPTAMAISGNGFFAVQQPSGQTANGQTTFNPQQYYTQAGNFTPNAQGYLVNSTGYVLDGYPVTKGVADTNQLQPIQISMAPSVPTPTANINLSANLPTTPPAGTTSFTSTEQVYDATGNAQQLTLNWAQVPTTAGSPISSTNPAVANEWTLTVSSAGSSTPATGPVLVTFGNTPTTAGTVTSLTPATTDPAGTVPATQSTGSPATVALAMDFGSGAQNINLNLGSFGSSSGLTQFSGTTYQVSSISQDGSSQGAYSGVSIQSNGDVVINYDNGQTSTIGQVALANFANPDGLQSQDGQAFTASVESGQATLSTPGNGGAGNLVVSSVEGSNVDIGTEFTNMIIAQQAYGANSKMITTANSMMQDVLNMVTG
jgi:flagellar hook protein FlgE